MDKFGLVDRLNVLAREAVPDKDRSIPVVVDTGSLERDIMSVYYDPDMDRIVISLVGYP